MPRYPRKRVDDTIISGFNPYQTWLIVVWYFNYIYMYIYIEYITLSIYGGSNSERVDVTYKHVLCSSVLQYRHLDIVII